MRELDRILKDDEPSHRAVQMMQGVQEYITMLLDKATDVDPRRLSQLTQADAACRRAENVLRQLCR